MIKRMGALSFALAACGMGDVLLAANPSTSPVTNLLCIQTVDVSGQSMPLRGNGEVKLGSFPKDIIFHYQANTNYGRLPIRLRYQLEGYESVWHEGDGETYLGVRYFNNEGDQVSQDTFKMTGESAGWKGSFKDSSLTHRRETVKVPPHASRLMLVISSAGPPQTEGALLIANLMVTRSSTPPVVLIQSPFDQQPYDDDESNQAPRNWMRDGNHASMAKIVKIGKDLVTKAFAILDDDPSSHAEWHSTIESAPRVTPGDDLVVEWNEMYSLGVGNIQTAQYDNLMVGDYKFRVEEVDIFGQPTGEEASLSVLVPPPFWRMPWFWGAVLAGATAMVFGGGRYLAWYRLQREMALLKSQQALERERLRIAHDIHDDLGARVTQISLLSAMSVNNPAFPEKAREDFDRISRMSRDLVSALYETVWAVNPENDNLDALGNYVCQMVNQLCESTQLRCRFHVSELPREIQVSSQTRHNISMAVKEAVHNAIKHAAGSEVVIQIAITGNELIISVKDDGCGFTLNGASAGHGLSNMKRRLEDIGGNCSIESQPGQGTKVRIELLVKSTRKT
jgi:signal transduction histidine kinase